MATRDYSGVRAGASGPVRMMKEARSIRKRSRNRSKLRWIGIVAGASCAPWCCSSASRSV